MVDIIKNNCPACLNVNSAKVGEKNNYVLERCTMCHTIFARVVFENRETTEEVKDLYDHYYDFANFKLHPAAEISLRKIVETFRDYRQTGNLLDIGFGEGGLLSIGENDGWKCYGTELSPQSLKFGEERSWIVSKDALNDDRFPKEGFDVVTMI